MTPPLGLLEFKAEDFELCKGELTEERMTQRAAHLANRLLAERLEEYLKNSKGEYSSMSECKRLIMMLRSALEEKTRELKELERYGP